jgi:hypothetical protein
MTMNQRFPNYRPSTALSQAITLYREAQKRRAEAEASAPGELGDPDEGGVAPGREGTDIGAAGVGSRRDQAGQPGDADIGALASGRKSDE